VSDTRRAASANELVRFMTPNNLKFLLLSAATDIASAIHEVLQLSFTPVGFCVRSMDWPHFTSSIEKNFSRHLYADQHLYIDQHLNKLCILGILPSHPCFSQKQTPLIQFEDEIKQAVQGISGKQKRGGSYVRPGDVLCKVSLEGEEFPVLFPIAGKPIELNLALESSCELLALSPEDRGWLVLLIPDRNAILPVSDTSENC